jgi:hypothetical protein
MNRLIKENDFKNKFYDLVCEGNLKRVEFFNSLLGNDGSADYYFLCEKHKNQISKLIIDSIKKGNFVFSLNLRTNNIIRG